MAFVGGVFALLAPNFAFEVGGAVSFGPDVEMDDDFLIEPDK